MSKDTEQPEENVWYRKKGYLHFDYALKKGAAVSYVLDPENITKHRFSPLIHYVKKARRLHKVIDKNTGAKSIKPKIKDRHIFYTSHLDGYIYSYYAHTLAEKYEELLARYKLTDNVIAYRAIKKNGIKYCNSHLAKEAFDFIRSTNGCHVLCYDVSKFFDSLCTDVLKKKWCHVLGTKTLPADHYKVYRSLTKFTYVDESKLIHYFGKSPRQHGLEEQGGSLRNRICSYQELRRTHTSTKTENKKFLFSQSRLQITGIPQGTAISGLLSNIFMIDFDRGMKKHIEKLGGCYRRYSDDILIAIPKSTTFSDIDAFTRKKISACCGNSIKINEKKTEKRIYQRHSDGRFQVTKEDGQPSKIQYLGFHFDGEETYLRNSSISKDRAKTVELIKKYKKPKGKINTKEVYKARSRRQITARDNLKSKGFVYYAERAAETHSSDKIIQQINKNDKFIKKIVEKERTRRRRRRTPINQEITRE